MSAWSEQQAHVVRFGGVLLLHDARRPEAPRVRLKPRATPQPRIASVFGAV